MVVKLISEQLWKELGKQWKAEDNDPVFANWGIYPFWGAELFALFLNTDDQYPVSVNATRFSKGKKKNAWGRYTNYYLAYTPPELRRKGYAKQLQVALEAHAVERGYHRMKSLTQSSLGIRLHMSLGHHFWGVNERNEVGVDTPLVTKDWPEGIPIEARAFPAAHSLTETDLLHILLKPPFSMKPWQIAIMFEEKPLTYRGASMTGNAPSVKLPTENEVQFLGAPPEVQP